MSTLTGSQFGRHVKLIALMCGVVLFIAATYLSLHLSYTSESRLHERLTQQSTQQINENVTLAIGTLFSMVAVHQTSSDGFDHLQFEMFADNLIKDQFAITAAGRFDQMLHDDLEFYSTEMQDHGIFTFAPKKMNINGELIPSEVKEQYSPLINFFPQDPVTANFIGMDLSEHNQTVHAIKKSVASSAPHAAQLPQKWIADGQLNVFAPSFYGHYIPESEEDRHLQTDGGYFVTLDLKKISTQSTPTVFPLSLTMALNSIGNEVLVQQPPGINEKRFAKPLFNSRSIEHNLNVGADSATILYNTPEGVTSSQITSALGRGFAALLLFGIVAAIIAALRVSKAKMLANEKALARARERALVTLNSLQDAVITTDHKDKVDYLNPSILQTLKVDGNDLIGLPLQEVLDRFFTEEQAPERSVNSNCNDQKIKKTTSLMRLKGDDSELGALILDCHSSSILNSNKEKIGAVLTMRDISKEHALTTELAHQATHDALTGLPNRRQFESVLVELLKSDVSNPQLNTIVGYVDLDQFKLINDTVGHAAGDDLLKKLAIDLQSILPEEFRLARLGGDEFGFIHSIDKESSKKSLTSEESVARLFYDFFQSYVYHTNGNAFAIRASIGVSNIKPFHININDVLSEVDIACYTAKDQGRNGYVIYDADDKDTKDREGEMLYLPLLQSALKNNRFVLYTQPIVTTQSHNAEAHHYECLIRLLDDDDKIITPYKFIVAAERYDLITEIDRWVIDAALQQIEKFKGTSLASTIFSINLSGQSAVDITMPDFIEEKLQQYNIDAATICFEFTETAVISNLRQAQKLITFLRKRGCTIALDDFGAGASSFGYLKNLTVDYLKIDGQFVKEITTDKVDYEMVRSMKKVGDALGIMTIAEFVENEDTMQALRDIEVDYAQGYHIGKPSPMDDLLKQKDSDNNSGKDHDLPQAA